MNKIQKLIISILLILAAIIIHFLIEESVKMNKELIGFFTGFCLAGGIFMFFSIFFKQKD